jgi:hypothetical protein
MKTGYRAKTTCQCRQKAIDFALDSVVGGALIAALTALVLGTFILYWLEL